VFPGFLEDGVESCTARQVSVRSPITERTQDMGLDGMASYQKIASSRDAPWLAIYGSVTLWVTARPRCRRSLEDAFGL